MVVKSSGAEEQGGGMATADGSGGGGGAGERADGGGILSGSTQWPHSLQRPQQSQSRCRFQGSLYYISACVCLLSKGSNMCVFVCVSIKYMFRICVCEY